MADLARAIQAANQRTEDIQAEYAALRERKEKLEEELAICIGWLGEAEVRAAAEEQRADRAESSASTYREELTMIALALKNEGLGEEGGDQVMPERGVEILIEEWRKQKGNLRDLQAAVSSVIGLDATGDTVLLELLVILHKSLEKSS